MAATAAETTVHVRGRAILDGTMEKTAACFDGVVEQPGFGLIAPLHSVNSAFGFDPFEHEAHDINRKGRRRVIERLLLDVRAVLQKGGKILVGALGKILA